MRILSNKLSLKGNVNEETNALAEKAAISEIKKTSIFLPWVTSIQQSQCSGAHNSAVYVVCLRLRQSTQNKYYCSGQSILSYQKCWTLKHSRLKHSKMKWVFFWMVNVIIKSSFQCASNYSQPQTEWRTDNHGCQLSKLTENTIISNWSWMIALLYFCKTSAPMTESTESVEACLWRAVPLFWSLSYNASVYGLVLGKGLSQAVYIISIWFFKKCPSYISI